MGFSLKDRLRHIHEAPLANLRISIWWIRKTFFTKPPSEAPAFVVPMDKPEAVPLLGQHHFEPGWELSYNYRGEILNLRRPEYYDHDSGYEWWQVHIRGYDRPDGMELTAHFETDPSEHPDVHISQWGIDVKRGMRELAEILDKHDVQYDRIDPPARHPPAPRN